MSVPVNKSSHWTKLSAVTRFLASANRNKRNRKSFRNYVNNVSKDNEELSEEAQSDSTQRMSKPANAMGFGNIFKDGAIKLKATNDLSPDEKKVNYVFVIIFQIF